MLEGARIVDCPGYGFASVSHREKENWRKFMETYLRDAQSLHRIVLLIDMTSGIQQTDQALIDILIDKQTPINIVMTKSDKVASKFIKQKTIETIEHLKAKGLLQLCSPIVNMVSSYTGYGMQELRCSLVQSYD